MHQRSGRAATCRPTAPESRNPRCTAAGHVAEGLQSSDRVFEGHYTSAHVNNAQLERRVSVAAWDGDRLTVYASTQGISNCQRDLAADLKIPAEHVRVVCEFMGGGFGNKNQCHDFDLMAAVLAKQAERTSAPRADAEGGLRRRSRPLADEPVPTRSA